MEKMNWGIFKGEKMGTYEKAINELVNLGLEKVQRLSENSEKMAYHGIEHTKQVMELSQKILELLEASSQEKIWERYEGCTQGSQSTRAFCKDYGWVHSISARSQNAI